MRSIVVLGGLAAFVLLIHGGPARPDQFFPSSPATGEVLDDVAGIHSGSVSGTNSREPLTSTNLFSSAWERGAVAALLTVVSATALVGTEPRFKLRRRS